MSANKISLPQGQGFTDRKYIFKSALKKNIFSRYSSGPEEG